MFELDHFLSEETKVEKEQRKSGFYVTDPDILDGLILSGNKFCLFLTLFLLLRVTP